MKKFEFRLKGVLNYKNRLRDLAVSELQNILARIAETDRKIEETETEFRLTNEAARRRCAEGDTPAGIASYRLHLERLRKRKNALIEEKNRLIRSAEAKKAEILQYKIDIAGLEKLEAAQRRSYDAEVRKAWEREVEEFVVSASLRAR